MLRDFGDASFSKFKEALAELATTRLTPIGGEMRRLMADPVEIDRILDDGARRAHAIADPILAMTKDIVGFIRSDRPARVTPGALPAPDVRQPRTNACRGSKGPRQASAWLPREDAHPRNRCPSLATHSPR